MTLFGLPFSELLALLTIVTILCGGFGAFLIMWLGNRFVKKSAYYLDKEESEAALVEYKEQSKIDLDKFKDKFDKLREDHITLTAGPLNEHTEALKKMNVCLEKMDQHSQQRQEAFLAAMAKLSERVTVVETKQHQRSLRRGHDNQE